MDSAYDIIFTQEFLKAEKLLFCSTVFVNIYAFF